MSPKSRKILVTGADGFIGSHLVEELHRQGHSVKAMALYNFRGSWGWLDQCEAARRKEIEVVLGDIRDPLCAREAVRGCDVVLHLAALIGIPYSYHAMDSYVDTNIKGTLNLLNAARDAGVSRFVHTSTSEVYGTAQAVPITEEHRLHAQSPYAATKVGADQMAMAFHASFELPVCVLRPFNTYGPRQSSRAVIPTVITQLLEKSKQVRLGSLHPTRDLCYVADTVRGFIAAFESAKAVGEVIQLGTGFEISIGDLAKLIAEVMGVRIEIARDDERARPPASEVDRLCASPAKAKKLLGWSPKFADIEGLRKGLAETIRWFSVEENRALYKSDVYQL